MLGGEAGPQRVGVVEGVLLTRQDDEEVVERRGDSRAPGRPLVLLAGQDTRTSLFDPLLELERASERLQRHATARRERGQGSLERVHRGSERALAARTGSETRSRRTSACVRTRGEFLRGARRATTLRGPRRRAR